MTNTQVVITMVVLVALIIAWDVWLFLDEKKGNTISERMRAADRAFVPFKYLVIFGFGLLTGHFWW